MSRVSQTSPVERMVPHAGGFTVTIRMPDGQVAVETFHVDPNGAATGLVSSIVFSEVVPADKADDAVTENVADMNRLYGKAVAA